MRKSLLFGVVFGFGLFSSFDNSSMVSPSFAQQQHYYAAPAPQQHYVDPVVALWQSMGTSERVIVDRLATDFYERSLRYAQSQAIEQQTSRRYSQAHPAQRSAYRNERRNQWQQLNQYQQKALRDAKRPRFIHLSDAQKWPFRTHALNQLGAAGAIQHGQATNQYQRHPNERGI